MNDSMKTRKRKALWLELLLEALSVLLFSSSFFTAVSAKSINPYPIVHDLIINLHNSFKA
jgi:hypothetical protein